LPSGAPGRILGRFPADPDYALWYGWSEMRRDLREIKEEAERLGREHEHHG